MGIMNQETQKKFESDCRYGRNLQQKGKNDAWISCELGLKDSIPEKFFIVLRDGVHAISMDITEEHLMSWIQYIKRHENKKYEEDKS